MTTPHEQFEECTKTFVSYNWFTTSLVGLLISIIIITTTAAIRVTEISERSKSNQERVTVVKQKLDQKIDMLINMVRDLKEHK